MFTLNDWITPLFTPSLVLAAIASIAIYVYARSLKPKFFDRRRRWLLASTLPLWIPMALATYQALSSGDPRAGETIAVEVGLWLLFSAILLSSGGFFTPPGKPARR